MTVGNGAENDSFGDKPQPLLQNADATATPADFLKSAESRANFERTSTNTHRIADDPHPPATNPYEPPRSHSDRVVIPHESHVGTTSVLPEPQFWGVAFASIALLTVATPFTSLPGLSLVLATCGGVFRVCLVYYYRAKAGLPALPANRLLLTSTLITYGLLLCSWIALACVCMGGMFLFELDNLSGLAWLSICVILSIVLFIFMFKLSIRLALK
jgi:hypothetical protein